MSLKAMGEANKQHVHQALSHRQTFLGLHKEVQTKIGLLNDMTTDANEKREIESTVAVLKDAHRICLEEFQLFDNRMQQKYRIIESHFLLVGGILYFWREDFVLAFFNQQMLLRGLAQAPGNPALSCQINSENNLACIQFRSVKEAIAGLDLDGVHIINQQLKIRRPWNYQEINIDYDVGNIMMPNTVSNRIFFGGFPVFFKAFQVKSCLLFPDQLKTFNLVTDQTGVSKGYAFAEYLDPSLTNQQIDLFHRNSCFAYRITEVLCLMNMVTEDELRSNEEYEVIMHGIREECMQYGVVKSIKVLKLLPGMEAANYKRKIYVEFNDKQESQNAQEALTGRVFENRTVVTSYYDPDFYHRGLF